MGVPKLNSWLKNRYPVAFDTTNSANLPLIDNLYIDLNGILHVIFRHHGKGKGNTIKDLSSKVVSDLDRIVSGFRPKQLLYIAADGAAPIAKLYQQRIRRMALARKRVREFIIKKAADLKEDTGEVFEDEMDVDLNIAPSELPQDTKFSNTWITPGTKFMKDLSQKIQEHICRKSNSTNPKDKAWTFPQIVYSGHDDPGEGEHKIINMMRRLSQHKASKGIKSCILGSDADLAVLALCLNTPNIIVVQNQEGSQTNYDCAYIDALGECIGRDLGPGLSQERVINDFAMLLSMYGNDFVPNVQRFTIEYGSLDNLMQTYTYYLETEGGFITNKASIDLARFKKLLSMYPIQPNLEMSGNITDKINGLLSAGGTLILKKPNFLQRSLIQQATASVDLQLVPCFNNLAKRQRLLDQDEMGQDLSILLTGTQSSNKFTTKFYPPKRRKLDSTSSNNPVAQDYFSGLQWVLHYYLHGVPSWDWLYPHRSGPTIDSLLGLQPSKPSYVLGAPLSPYETLLAILPPTCANLLPPALQPLMMDDDSPLRDFYALSAHVRLDVTLFRKILHDPSLPYAEVMSCSQNSWGSALSLKKDSVPSFTSPAVVDESVFRLSHHSIPLAFKYRSLGCVPSFALTQPTQGNINPGKQFIYLANQFTLIDTKIIADLLFKREVILVSWPDVKIGRIIRLTTSKEQYQSKFPGVLVSNLPPEEQAKWRTTAKACSELYLKRFRVDVGPIEILVHYTGLRDFKCPKCHRLVEQVAPLQTLLSLVAPQVYYTANPLPSRDPGCWGCSKPKLRANKLALA